MTKEEQQGCLYLAKEMLRKAEPMLDNKSWKELHAKLISDLGSDGPGSIGDILKELPQQVSRIIAFNELRLKELRDLVSMLENTPAEQLEFNEVAALFEVQLTPPTLESLD